MAFNAQVRALDSMFKGAKQTAPWRVSAAGLRAWPHLSFTSLGVEEQHTELRRYDRVTFLQGATAGLTMSLIAFIAASRSLTLAGLFSAAVGVGMMSSRVFNRLSPRAVSLVMFAARTVALFAAFNGNFVIAIAAAAVGGSTSRRLFIDLKHRVGPINASRLVAHGAWNAVGFGIGAAAAGVLLDHELLAQLVAFTVALAALIVFPSGSVNAESVTSGLTRRDLVASVLFSFASNPLLNATAPLLLLDVVGSEVAGLSSLCFTLGSLLATHAARVLMRAQDPVALAVVSAGLSFAVLLMFPHPLLILGVRFLDGMLLYAAQGVLEIRSQRDGEGRGLESLWTWLSAASIAASFAVPYSVDVFGIWTAVLWPIVGAALIAVLTRVPTRLGSS